MNDAMDPLSETLAMLRPRSYVTGTLSAGGAWALQIPAHDGIKCYVVVKGELRVAVTGCDDTIRLQEGNCLLLPHGRPFVIGSDPSLLAIDAQAFVAQAQSYNGVRTITAGDDVRVLGCHFDLGADGRVLLDVLPVSVLVKNDEGMRHCVNRIIHEMRTPLPGGALVARQAASTLLVDALRLHLCDAAPRSRGWLAALADKQVRSAMSGIHQAPAHAWTLEELARLSGMSRTAFANRFRQTVGETPMAYLTRWRLTLAANRLRDRREPVSRVASAVGYLSESAFCAAFKRRFGHSPRHHTKIHRDLDDARPGRW